MKLDSLPLPQPLKSLLGDLGYSELYPPQQTACESGVFEGTNLLLTTPTASGKTLVAYMAAGRLILEGLGKVVYLTPLRALASEKYEEFKTLERLQKPDGGRIRVVISTGDYDSSGESLGVGDVIILTNERFDSLLRHNVSWLDSVRLFVADEIHLVGDHHRGPTIETILAKVLTFVPEAQILGLSATVSNSDVLAEWLGARLVDVKWRPVRLVEGVFEYNRIVYDGSDHRTVEPTGRGSSIDVAIDSIKEGGQSLVFTETRRRAVSMALKASEVTRRFLSGEDKAEGGRLAGEILGEEEETELGRSLAKAVTGGAAFHHAGLSSRHRRMIEDGFRRGVIKVLCATPTLAAGVNLPARRVVVSSLMRYDSEYGGQTLLSVLEYKQLAGRAGRPRFDSIGEVVIIPPPSMDAQDVIENYVRSEPEPVRSQLSNVSAVRTHLLATIATYPGMSRQNLDDFFSKTLFAMQYRKAALESRISKGLEYLMDENLVETRGKRYIATEFGRRISMLYISPETGVLFRDELKSTADGREHTSGLLHLTISAPDFTPKFSLRNQDWEKAVDFLEEHQSEFLRPNPRIGSFGTGDFLGSFRTLMAMHGWINEWHSNSLLDSYGVEPGDLHRCVESADWLLYSLREVARLIGKTPLISEVDELILRNRYGVKKELLPLISLEGVGRVRARALHNAGYTSPEKLLEAKVEALARLPKIGPTIARSIKQQLQQKSARRGRVTDSAQFTFT